MREIRFSSAVEFSFFQKVFALVAIDTPLCAVLNIKTKAVTNPYTKRLCLFFGFSMSSAASETAKFSLIPHVTAYAPNEFAIFAYSSKNRASAPYTNNPNH